MKKQSLKEKIEDIFCRNIYTKPTKSEVGVYSLDEALEIAPKECWASEYTEDERLCAIKELLSKPSPTKEEEK